ncbi:acetyltransferase [Deltaproteobacteria bacterium Smac51]|nr:acetyltransferase [Deltaproteobacteria bacterium Smac51]
MTELEKLEAGLEFCFFDPQMVAIKNKALRLCTEFNNHDPADFEGQEALIKRLFGSTGRHVYIQPRFNCDNGQNIHVGEDFLTNYNVTILDVAPVRIGDYCLIGPNTLISTVGHPLTPKGRREKLSRTAPVTIGNDVWIGGNCTILPGVTIGNNVIVAAGAVVTHDVPDNSLVGGVPAKVLRPLENDVNSPA